MINRFIALSVLVHAFIAGALCLYFPAAHFPTEMPVLDVSFTPLQRDNLKIAPSISKRADIPSSPPVLKPKKSVSNKLIKISTMSVDIAQTSEKILPRFHDIATAIPDAAPLKTEDKFEKLTTPPQKQYLATISGKVNADNDGDNGAALRANHLMSELRGTLNRHFIYPPLARRHGWQGTVHVGLRLNTRGQLGALRVVRSSGYAILDDDAIKTLERIESIPRARIWLDGRPFETELTVIYRLIES